MIYQHSAEDRAAAFEWLRELATKDGADRMAGVVLDTWYDEATTRSQTRSHLDPLVQLIDGSALPGAQQSVVNSAKRLLEAVK